LLIILLQEFDVQTASWTNGEALRIKYNQIKLLRPLEAD